MTEKHRNFEKTALRSQIAASHNGRPFALRPELLYEQRLSPVISALQVTFAAKQGLEALCFKEEAAMPLVQSKASRPVLSLSKRCRHVVTLSEVHTTKLL